MKTGDYCDLLVDPNDGHATVISKAARLLALEPETCTLYRSSGVKVVDQDIVDDGQRYPWSIGHYIRKTYARSSAIKLGLFCEEVNLF